MAGYGSIHPDQIIIEMTMKQTFVTLNDGNRIPQFGLGVYQIAGDDNTEKVCLDALQIGYRHIDTAVQS